MKKISLLLILCAAYLILSAHEEPSKTLNEQKDKAKARQRIVESGIVKSVTWKYAVIDGMLSENGSKVIGQEYDRNGNMTAIEAYKNDSVTERVEYTFDLNNNMLSDIDNSADGKMIEKNSYSYDNEGRVISGNCFDDKEQLTAFFVYDKSTDKKSITFLKYKEKDSLDYKIEYLYNSDFDKTDFTEANKYDSKNNLTMRVIKTLNADGKQTEKAIYGGDLALMYTFYYEYDDKGNYSAISKKKPDGTTEWKDLYSYDKYGNCTEINSFDSNDKLKSVIKYSYEYSK